MISNRTKKKFKLISIKKARERERLRKNWYQFAWTLQVRQNDSLSCVCKSHTCFEDGFAFRSRNGTRIPFRKDDVGKGRMYADFCFECKKFFYSLHSICMTHFLNINVKMIMLIARKYFFLNWKITSMTLFFTLFSKWFAHFIPFYIILFNLLT